MKYFRDIHNTVYAYESDGSQDSYIRKDLIRLSEGEALDLANYKTKDQIRSEVISRRNFLLKSSDWTQVNDSPLSPELKKAWGEYRQALRDITSQKNFPKKITWPKEPK